jgi:hypothetical protein
LLAITILEGSPPITLAAPDKLCPLPSHLTSANFDCFIYELGIPFGESVFFVMILPFNVDDRWSKIGSLSLQMIG